MTEQYVFPYTTTSVAQLPDSIANLILAAQRATDTAYAPYSNFKVGAAALLDNDEIKRGANKENASYAVGICAERALLYALDFASSGSPKIVALAVAYQDPFDTGVPITPCGMCRQAILEVQQAQKSVITLYLTSPKGNVIVIDDAASLLPLYFGRERLSVSEP